MQGSLVGRAIGLTACFLRMRVELFLGIFTSPSGFGSDLRSIEATDHLSASCLADLKLHCEIAEALGDVCFSDQAYMQTLAQRYCDYGYWRDFLLRQYRAIIPTHRDLLKGLTKDACAHSLRNLLVLADSYPPTDVDEIEAVLRDLEVAAPTDPPLGLRRLHATLPLELSFVLGEVRRIPDLFHQIARRFLPQYSSAVVEEMADSLSNIGAHASRFFETIERVFDEPALSIDLSDRDRVCNCLVAIGRLFNRTLCTDGQGHLVALRLRFFDLFARAAGLNETTMCAVLSPDVLERVPPWVKLRAAAHCPALWPRLAECTTEAAAVYLPLFYRA